jgi:8-oxo-dGTP pyrophosphatase MutT (NUDIX family)
VRFDEVLARLSHLPEPLPAPPRAIDPVVVGRLDDLPPWVRRGARSSRRAAALVLLYPGADGEAHVVLTERPAGDLRHAGQISLPGGAADAGDDFPVGTALREAREEVGFDAAASGVRTLGVLETVEVRVSGFLLVPVLGVIDHEPALTADAREVAAILHVPVATFLPASPIEVVETERDGYRLRFGAYVFAGHRIWGATARVLGQLGAVLVGD